MTDLVQGSETSSKRQADGANRAAILDTVARLEQAQQRENVDAFLQLFRHDAVWVTAHGRRLIDRDEIGAFTEQVLPGAMQDSTARYDVAHVSFVRPDVAVVNVDQVPIALDGEPLPMEPQGRPLYVMSKEDSGWLIAAGQNTQVSEQ
jgi:uncharacterized protein (TIGR02246 family)